LGGHEGVEVGVVDALFEGDGLAVLDEDLPVVLLPV